MHSLIFHINHPFFNTFEQQNFHNLKQRILDTARERSILVRVSYRISSSLRFPWTKERRERENPVSPSRHLSSREDLRHVSNSKQFCDSIRDRERRKDEVGWQMLSRTKRRPSFVGRWKLCQGRMAAFRRRPITIGNARPTGLAGIILDEYRVNDIPLEKEIGARDRTHLSP